MGLILSSYYHRLNVVSVHEESDKNERMMITSPRASILWPDPKFNCYDMDIWTEVARHLDRRELLMWSVTNCWFNCRVSPRHVPFPWKEIYAAAFDGSHTYCFRHQDKHIDWMGIRSFYLDSPYALLTETLSLPRRIPRPGGIANRSIQLTGTCSITNAKSGIWIPRTMQVLDARHMELFLQDGYLNGTWQYKEIGSNRIPTPSEAAIGGILDMTRLSCQSTSSIAEPLVSTSEKKLTNIPHSHDDLYPTFPWILRHRSSPYEEANLEFYSIPFDKVFYVACPEALGKKFLCSKGGYFLCKTNQDFGLDFHQDFQLEPTGAFLSLINPLLHDEIVLPSYNTLIYNHIFSSPSQLSDFVVMFGALDKQIAKIPFHDLSRQAWDETELNGDYGNCWHFCLKGMLFSENKLSGGTMVTELTTGNLVLTIPPVQNSMPQTGPVYIVEASGSILKVLRSVETMRWTVYQLDYDTGTWARTSDIGNFALFIDRDGGFALHASQVAGIKSNTIYLLDPGSNVRIVHIGDGHVNTLRYPWEQLGHWFRPNIQSLPH